MNFTGRHLAYLFGVLLLISLSANVYFYQQTEPVTTIQSESHTSNETETTLPATPSTDSKKPVVASEDTRVKEIVKSAHRFIEYAFTVSKDSYTTQKRQASEVMSEDLANLLFDVHGSDTDTFNIHVRDIEVFPSASGENCLVRFNQDLLITETGYEERTTELVALTIESIDGRLLVTEMEDLTSKGGI